MLKLLKYLVLVAVSFVAALELFNVLSFTNNLLQKEEPDTSVQSTPEGEPVVFLGDSYAATVYVKDNYAKQFDDFFSAQGYNFIDLSRPGLSLDETDRRLDSVYTQYSPAIPKLAIYYYTIVNVMSFERGSWANGITATRTPPKAEKERKKDFNWKEDSATVLMLKDILHTLSLTFIGKPFPGTLAGKHPALNVKHQENLRQVFNSIQAEQVIVVINTPFNYGPKLRKWEHYEMFKSMELNDNVTLVQTIDIVDDGDHALSWRNGHPNQEAIDKVATKVLEIAQGLDLN
ncbi:MAG: hypothetical protein AAGJ93_14045 [Bacteroidota bacterium]